MSSPSQQDTFGKPSAKMLIITPEELAKLGLVQHIQTALKDQPTPKKAPKRGSYVNVSNNETEKKKSKVSGSTKPDEISKNAKDNTNLSTEKNITGNRSTENLITQKKISRNIAGAELNELIVKRLESLSGPVHISTSGEDILSRAEIEDLKEKSIERSDNSSKSIEKKSSSLKIGIKTSNNTKICQEGETSNNLTREVSAKNIRGKLIKNDVDERTESDKKLADRLVPTVSIAEECGGSRKLKNEDNLSTSKSNIEGVEGKSRKNTKIKDIFDRNIVAVVKKYGGSKKSSEPLNIYEGPDNLNIEEFNTSVDLQPVSQKCDSKIVNPVIKNNDMIEETQSNKIHIKSSQVVRKYGRSKKSMFIKSDPKNPQNVIENEDSKISDPSKVAIIDGACADSVSLNIIEKFADVDNLISKNESQTEEILTNENSVINDLEKKGSSELLNDGDLKDSTPLVKKRGRPKKIDSSCVLLEDSEEENLECEKNDAENEDLPNPVKKRGRPKKIDSSFVLLEDSEEENLKCDKNVSDNVIVEENLLSSVKKRGRPKKIDSSVLLEDSEETSLNGEENVAENVIVEENLPYLVKKRGRPKKIDSSCVLLEDSEEENLECEKNDAENEDLPNPVKKRGRPKKIDSSFVLLEDSEEENLKCDKNVSDNVIVEENLLSSVKKRGRPKKIDSSVLLEDSEETSLNGEENVAENVIVEENLPYLVKKRGRPKKIDSSCVLLEDSEEENLDCEKNDAENEDLPNPVKKRGRPKKMDSSFVLLEDSEEENLKCDKNVSDNVIVEENLLSSVKKRGRPKKIDSSVLLEDSEETSLNGEENVAENVIVEENLPYLVKKRGRPKKIDSSLSLLEDNEEANLECEKNIVENVVDGENLPTSVKKRGRPKKFIEEANSSPGRPKKNDSSDCVSSDTSKKGELLTDPLDDPIILTPVIKNYGRPRKIISKVVKEAVKLSEDKIEESVKNVDLTHGIIIASTPVLAKDETFEKIDSVNEEEVDESENLANLSMEVSKNSDISSTPAKKKRGRPKKSDSVKKTPEIIVEKKEVITVSGKTGRMRKSVNYYELANPRDIEEENRYTKKRRRISDSDEECVIKSAKKPRKPKHDLKEQHLKDNEQQNTTEISKIEEESNEVPKGEDMENEEQQKATEISATEEEKSEKRNEMPKGEDVENESQQKTMKISAIEEEKSEKSNELPKGEDMENEEQQKTTEISATEEEKPEELPRAEDTLNEDFNASTVANDSKSSEKTKREKSGVTIRMLNNLFNILKTPDAPEHHNIVDRRVKTSSTKKYTVTDGNLTCAECQKVMPEKDWDDHNFNEHYTFSWRVGEDSYVLKYTSGTVGILRNILKVKKVLVCKRCNAKTRNPEKYLKHRQECDDPLFKEGTERKNQYTCAVCNMEIEKTKWAAHKYKSHANLAWRVGEPPMDLNDQNLVMSTLNKLYKEKKPIYCGKCGISKKSVIGFLSHQTMCQKDEEELENLKVECKLCGSRVLPVSMAMHMKCSHKQNQDETSILNPGSLDEMGELGKRQAHKKAISMINQFKGDGTAPEHTHYTYKMVFDAEYLDLILEEDVINTGSAKCKFRGCSTIASSAEEIIKHMQTCINQRDSYFVCKYCLFICAEEVEIRSHLQTIHRINCRGKMIMYDPDSNFNAEDEVEDPEENVIPKRTNVELRVTPKPAFLQRKLRKFGQTNCLFGRSFKWTYNFHEENYNDPRLFDKFGINKSQWLLLEDILIDAYLPQLNNSCDIACATTTGFKAIKYENITFKKYELFETEVHENGNFTIFAGGPVNALSWMPTPYTHIDSRQILAVAVLNGPNKTYYHDANYHERNLIQFWDFGVLRNNQEQPVNAKLTFCIAHDFGPIWELEWCPSGCYDVDDSSDNRRMGLLAVAGSDSCVYIYSIPCFGEEESGLFYKAKPVLKLQFGKISGPKLGKQKFYATKLSWSKLAGHKIIAVGYSNGAVALFDIDKNSSLLQNSESFENQVLLPYRSFQAHYHYITGIHILPFPGCKVLATASFDRELLFWDLNSLTTIFSWKKKNVITCVGWLTNWVGAISSIDDGSSSSQNVVSSMITQVRDFTCEWGHLLPSASTIKSVTTSDWLNSVAHVNTAGEIFGFLGQKLLGGVDTDKNIKNLKMVFGTTRLIKDSDKTHENLVEPVIYEEAIQKYKVLLADCKLKYITDFPKSVIDDFNKKMLTPQPDLYPLNCINKAAFNPNLQASTFLATGYQIGLVRVMPLKFICQDSQVK